MSDYDPGPRSIDGEDIEPESVRAMRDLIAGPNLVGDLSDREVPAVIRATDASRGASLGFQNRDDAAVPADETNNQYAGIYHYSESGARLAEWVHDTYDEHMSLYLKENALGDGDVQPAKALDIYWNVPFVVSWRQIGEWKAKGVAGDTNLSMALDAGDASQDINFRYRDQNAARLWSHYVDRSRGDSWILWRDGSNIAFEVGKDGGLDTNFHDNPIHGLREIANPTKTDLFRQEWAWDSTNDRWLYRDADSVAHYFTPDGTL